MFSKLPKELYENAEGDYCLWDFRRYLPKVVYLFSRVHRVTQSELF